MQNILVNYRLVVQWIHKKNKHRRRQIHWHVPRWIQMSTPQKWGERVSYEACATWWDPLMRTSWERPRLEATCGEAQGGPSRLLSARWSRHGASTHPWQSPGAADPCTCKTGICGEYSEQTNEKKMTRLFSVKCGDLHFTQFRVQHNEGAVIADGRQHGGAGKGTEQSLNCAATHLMRWEYPARGADGHLCVEKASWFTRRAWMVSTFTGSASRKSVTVTLPSSSPEAGCQQSIKTPQRLPMQ